MCDDLDIDLLVGYVELSLISIDMEYRYEIIWNLMYVAMECSILLHICVCRDAEIS